MTVCLYHCPVHEVPTHEIVLRLARTIGKNLGTYNVQTLSETAESTRHYITFSTLPKNCTQEYPYQDHTNSPVIRQRVVPIFPQG